MCLCVYMFVFMSHCHSPLFLLNKEALFTSTLKQLITTNVSADAFII